MVCKRVSTAFSFVPAKASLADNEHLQNITLIHWGTNWRELAKICEHPLKVCKHFQQNPNFDKRMQASICVVFLQRNSALTLSLSTCLPIPANTIPRTITLSCVSIPFRWNNTPNPQRAYRVTWINEITLHLSWEYTAHIVLLTNYEVFENVMKPSPEYLIYVGD